MSNHAQARLRIMRTLDGLPEGAPGDLTVILDASGTASSRIAARFVTHLGAGGLKIETGATIDAGLIVGLAGQIQSPTGLDPVLGQFKVLACMLTGVSKYHSNLTPHNPGEEPEPPPQARRAVIASDYYEILQVSRGADTETIHRVFHLLAQRYHPDNRDTGSDEKFRLLVEAHAVLGDPARRAAHDVNLSETDRGRLRIFESIESSEGVEAETRKRQGILRLLYTRRLTNPREPSLRLRDFVEILGCPGEHLEFAFWYLKENKFVQRADNHAFEITFQGVDAFEQMERTQPLPAHRSLPAPVH